jgi:cyanate lyase
MTRDEVALAVTAARLSRGLSWQDLADAIDKPVVWVVAALLGQHPVDAADGSTLATKLGLPQDIVPILAAVPMRGSRPRAVSTDPTIYRLYEVLQVYGPALKELIHEEFGDGIMSTVNFGISLKRRKHRAGDRVVITLDGKFLPYEWPSKVGGVTPTEPSKQAKVPNLLGLTAQEATNELVEAGLAVGATKHKQDPAQDGEVVLQGTVAGTSVPRGTEVDLVVAVNLAAPSITAPAAGADFGRDGPVDVRWSQAEPWVGRWKVRTAKQTCYYYVGHSYRDCRWDEQAEAEVTAATYAAAFNMSYQPLLDLGWFQTGPVRAVLAAVDDFGNSGPEASVEFRIS